MKTKREEVFRPIQPSWQDRPEKNQTYKQVMHKQKKMDIKINPIDIIKQLVDSKRLKKNEVVEYVERIANEAIGIADAWEFVSKRILQNTPIETSKSDFLSIELKEYYYSPRNAGPFSALQHFYELTSRAIGDKVNGYWLNEIYNHIGAVLVGRKDTFNAYENLIKEFNNPLFFNNKNYEAKTRNLLNSVAILRNEAEALKVLAYNMKLEKIK